MKWSDVILFLFIFILIGLAIYIVYNINIVKQIDSGNLHPCKVCEQKYGADCLVKGRYFDWQIQPMVEINITK